MPNSLPLPSERTALVLYGSETGNAQDVAEELSRLCQQLRFSTSLRCLDSIQPAPADSGCQNVLNTFSVVLIAISTTGQGDLPANARLFWKQLLRKKLAGDFLSRTRFALFGLGDSSYPQYNWAALKLNKRLSQLGAIEVVIRGEGDEQHPEGCDASFIPWSQGLREKLLSDFPLVEGQSVLPDNVLLQPPWLLGELADLSARTADTGQGTRSAPAPDTVDPLLSPQDLFEVTLKCNERLTPDKHFQDVRHLVFETAIKKSYMPGDILTIYPENDSEDVEQLTQILGWQDVADREIDFIPNPLYKSSTSPPKPVIPRTKLDGVTDTVTLRRLLTFNLDFNAIPRRTFFSLVAHFTEDEFQKERLLEFANPELVDELFDYTTRPRRSILEVLQEFDTLKVPWQWASTILPVLRGRQFSIASGGDLKDKAVSEANQANQTRSVNTRFELLVAIVKYRTVIKKIRRGVCTRYLEGLTPGKRLNVTLQKGTLDATPTDLTRPAILVGPGTGLAPVRALIWERWAWQVASQHSIKIDSSETRLQAAPTLLFFGCRSKDADFFFKNEWETLQSFEMPLSVFVAFSRDQDRKIYVQDRIVEQYELVYKYLFQQDGLFFVCGSSGSMPQAVRGALLDVMQKGGSLNPDEAEMQLKKLEKTGRYKQETW